MLHEVQSAGKSSPFTWCKMCKRLSKAYILFLAFALGAMTGCVISKWLMSGIKTWRWSNPGSLSWSESPSKSEKYAKNVTVQLSVEPLYSDKPATSCKCYRVLSETSPLALPRMVYQNPDLLRPPRNDVMILTPWLAPIIWEGTFNYDILLEKYKLHNYTVGLTVSVIGTYVKLLKKFLESAERYFIKDGKVNYYVFTDRPDDVKALDLKINRTMKVIPVPRYASWEETVLGRMEVFTNLTKLLLWNKVDYLVSMDADIVLLNHIGVEILGELVAAIHPGFYRSSRQYFSYERRPASQAFIPKNEGDFYYQSNFFVGTVPRIYHMAKACHKGIMVDKANGIQAWFHEESHFNKYLVYNKPTKLLSPEYIWSNSLGSPKEIKIKRVNHGNKNE
ncbi:histo-blood group ABO system transferase 1 [Microcaecilia unicolor]|uniref:Histo-blood group ABO system transferase 1-like n=1 Tax=Microcaecilia unicolor TaxID=1415580 RepID=A0A6P7X6P0_9AMPH|nr:histo-blood group ABO system transferase 1-like [Microcaecilia unicolor]